MRVIRFWKPYGVLTKFTDAEGRPTLADYIDVPGVYTAGRLDRDSEGLLLLTDSGSLNTRLTDPAFAHPRTYLVQVERIPDEAALLRRLNCSPRRLICRNAPCRSASARMCPLHGCA